MKTRETAYSPLVIFAFLALQIAPRDRTNRVNRDEDYTVERL